MLKLFKMNKKAVMDDFFDFMYTVFMAFFLLIFIGALFSGMEDRNTRHTDFIVEITESNQVNQMRERFSLEADQTIDLVQLEETVLQRRRSYLESE